MGRYGWGAKSYAEKVHVLSLSLSPRFLVIGTGAHPPKPSFLETTLLRTPDLRGSARTPTIETVRVSSKTKGPGPEIIQKFRLRKWPISSADFPMTPMDRAEHHFGAFWGGGFWGNIRRPLLLPAPLFYC